MRLVVGLLVTANSVFAGWQGARTIAAPDTAASFVTFLATATDNFGCPWAIWEGQWRSSGDEFLELSHWNGMGWDEPAKLPDTIGHAFVGSYVDFTFDPVGRLCLVYPTEDHANQCEILSARYDPMARVWELPRRVNDSDTTPLDDFYPRISEGGEQIWAAWFKEVGSRAICDIKANYWNSGAQSWEPDMTVNPDTGDTINRMEWFPDIALDTTGMPHIVWTKATPSIPGVLLYSRYENGVWRQSEELTDPDSFVVSGPYGGTRPRLVADNQSDLYCAFVGYPQGGSIDGVYWCRYNSQSGWSAPARIDRFTPPADPIWDKDIAAIGPNNVWIVYDRGNGGEWRIYAQHFDGSNWSDADRIDDGMTHDGGFPKVSLDASGDPFVIWSADSGGTGQYAIWFNHFSSAPVAESRAGVPALALQLSVSPNPFRDHVSFQVTTTSLQTRLRIYDISGQLVRDFPVRQAIGGKRQAVVSWDGTDALGRKLANGVYLARLETGDGTTVTKQVLLLRR